MKIYICILSLVGLFISPVSLLAKHACILGAPRENCSHEIADCTDIKATLKRGSKSQQVLALQKYLQTFGYLQTEPSGYFGVLSTAAVKEFQSAHNIDTTGIAGPLTRRAIKNNSCKTINNNTEQSTTTNTIQNNNIPIVKISSTSTSGSGQFNALKVLLRSLGIDTNFATTTMNESQILEMTRRFEEDYIFNK